MADHAWCHDIARDAAVRAAEDGRTGPLPTLEEAIARAGQFMPQEAQQGQKCTERESGMRTERVTLEITQFKNSGYKSPSELDWEFFLRGEALTDGESVRVVEEAHFDDLAQVAMERDAAIREREKLRGEIASVRNCWDVSRAANDVLKARVAELEQSIKFCSGSCGFSASEQQAASGNSSAILTSSQAASGGGEQEPVAWMCEWTDHAELYGSRTQAERAAAGDVVPQPLYRCPPQPRGWLTDEERKAVELAAYQAPESYYVTTAEGKWITQTLTALLARSSPPEVALPAEPDCSPIADYGRAWRDCLDAVRSALASAGVAVKEVGK